MTIVERLIQDQTTAVEMENYVLADTLIETLDAVRVIANRRKLVDIGDAEVITVIRANIISKSDKRTALNGDTLVAGDQHFQECFDLEDSVALLKTYMPSQMNVNIINIEITKLLKATDIDNIGQVLGHFHKTFPNQFDGKLVHELAKDKLRV